MIILTEEPSDHGALAAQRKARLVRVKSEVLGLRYEKELHWQDSQVPKSGLINSIQQFGEMGHRSEC